MSSEGSDKHHMEDGDLFCSIDEDALSAEDVDCTKL